MVLAQIYKDGQCIIDHNDIFYEIERNTFILNKEINKLRIVIGCEKYQKQLVLLIRMYDEGKKVFEMETCFIANKVSFPVNIQMNEQKVLNNGEIHTYYKKNLYTMTNNDYEFMKLNCFFRY